jgi:hypothetical protein
MLPNPRPRDDERPRGLGVSPLEHVAVEELGDPEAEAGCVPAGSGDAALADLRFAAGSWLLAILAKGAGR